MNFDFPAPNPRRIALHVQASAERHLRQGHPWLFESAITKQSHAGQSGDLAVVYDRKNRFLALGFYDPDSPIRVKLVQHGAPSALDEAWWRLRLSRALMRRALLTESDTDGYRLIHGENDGFPALVLDQYAQTLVLKLYSALWYAHLPTLLPLVRKLIPAERCIVRLSRNMPALYGVQDGMALWGDVPSAPLIFHENGLQFSADVVHGHKTGFFFDQRDNRASVRELAQGRRVLDVYAYSGGFSVYAGDGGAQSVLSVDISAPALASAQANWQLNVERPSLARAQHQVQVGDALAVLRELRQAGRTFDLVIVDPPSFAKRADESAQALVSYASLARASLDVLEAGGIWVMASCSSRVSKEQFFEVLEQTARKAGRRLQDIDTTEHAVDHPIGFSEGAYLKCLYARLGN